MTEKPNSPQQQDPDNQESLSVDAYMNWITTLEPLTPEERYVVITKSGSVIVEGGSPALIKAHGMVLASARAECDEEDLVLHIKRANYAVYKKNKGAYIFAGISVLVAVSIAAYKFAKFISNAF